MDGVGVPPSVDVTPNPDDPKEKAIPLPKVRPAVEPEPNAVGDAKETEEVLLVVPNPKDDCVPDTDEAPNGVSVREEGLGGGADVSDCAWTKDSAVTCGWVSVDTFDATTSTGACGRGAVLLVKEAAKQSGLFSFSKEKTESEPSVDASNNRNAPVVGSCMTCTPTGK